MPEITRPRRDEGALIRPTLHEGLSPPEGPRRGAAEAWTRNRHRPKMVVSKMRPADQARGNGVRMAESAPLPEVSAATPP